MRKTLGTIVALATAMSLLGVAWASDDVGVGASGQTQSEIEVSSSITTADGGTSVTIGEDDSTSTSFDDDETTTAGVAGVNSDTVAEDDLDSTSTTIDDDNEDEGGEDGSTTSTTLDDDDDDDDDEVSSGASTDLGVHTYVVPGVGAVTIEVLSSGLKLVSIEAPDWTVDIEKVERDRIRIEFHRGEDEAEFEAELHSSGGLSVEIDDH